MLEIKTFEITGSRRQALYILAILAVSCIPVELVARPTAAPSRIVLDPSRTAGVISPLLFGHNLEHTRRAVWQGISAQMLANRKFAGASTTDSRAGVGTHGFIGRLRTQGGPGPDGVAAHWYGIGNSWTNFYVDDEIAFAGRTSQRLDLLQEGARGGVGQAGLAVQSGMKYEIRLQLRTHFGMKAFLRLCDSSGDKTYFEESAIWSGNEWHTWTVEWTAKQDDPSARLEITFEGPGTAWLGAASMMPADNFHGLRSDVMEVLKDMSVPFLRWPGGNFTRNWKWKDGLLPVDSRPPVIAKNHESLPFTDNYDFHEIGIDDFMALCERLGAESTLVLNITDELQSALDLVEYCNGPADSGWGKLRAERGHPEPYAVKYWSVGNENFGQWMGPAYFPPAEYGLQFARFGAAMRKIDPSILIIGSGNHDGYCRDLVAAAGQHLDLISGHNYLFGPESDSLAGPEILDKGRSPTLKLRDYVAGLRTEIEQGAVGGKTIPISFDEWNLWHWWFVRPFERKWHCGPVDGMYAASALNMFCRESGKLNIHSALFFEPVNEGCIVVESHSARLTAAGQVFRLYRAHHGNRLIETPRPETDEDLDICASLGDDGNRLVVTLLNRNFRQARTAELELAGGRTVRATTVKVLSASDLSDPDVVFEDKPLKVKKQDNLVRLELPRYSIALLEIELLPRAGAAAR